MEPNVPKEDAEYGIAGAAVDELDRNHGHLVETRPEEVVVFRYFIPSARDPLIDVSIDDAEDGQDPLFVGSHGEVDLC